MKSRQTGPASLTPLSQALEALLADMPSPIGSETLPLASALGRILARGQSARASVPPWDNAAMDGYALCLSDLAQGRDLPISQRIAAGQAATPLQAGSCARIFTGAPVPPGADAVVMQENCRVEDGRVHVLQLPDAGENIRRAGDDVAADHQVLDAGHRLRPADIGLLAACGHSHVPVRKRLRVALLVTGDELKPPGSELASGQIYNSNQYSLAALIHSLGMECLDGDVVPDDRLSTEQALEQAAGQADCIVTSGGVSAGEEDHMRAAIESRGDLRLWKLALKPGKPFAYGRLSDRPLFALPGNPVSAFVTFLLLVRPCLLRMSGVADCLPHWMRLPAGFSRSVSGQREEYLRVQLQHGDEGTVLQPFSSQSSGVLSSLSLSDGLAVIPPHTAVRPGDQLRFAAFSDIVS